MFGSTDSRGTHWHNDEMLERLGSKLLLESSKSRLSAQQIEVDILQTGFHVGKHCVHNHWDVGCRRVNCELVGVDLFAFLESKSHSAK